MCKRLSSCQVNPEPSRGSFRQARNVGGSTLKSHTIKQSCLRATTPSSAKQHQITAQSRQVAQHRYQHLDNHKDHQFVEPTTTQRKQAPDSTAAIKEALKLDSGKCWYSNRSTPHTDDLHASIADMRNPAKQVPKWKPSPHPTAQPTHNAPKQGSIDAQQQQDSQSQTQERNLHASASSQH